MAAQKNIASTVAYLLAIILISGCGESDDTPAVEANLLEPGGEAAPQGFSSRIAEMTAEARQLEANLKFKSASERWVQIEQEIVDRLGADSWQAQNARRARESSVAKSNYTADQRELLHRIEKANEQARDAFQNENFDQALSHSLAMFDLQCDLTGERSIEAGQLAVQIATLHSRLGQLEHAISRFHAGIEILRERGFVDHPELQLAHAGLAAAYARQGKLSPAIANQKRATRIAGILKGDHSAAYAAQANQLGVLYHRAENFDVAHDILRTARAIRERSLGKDSVAYAHSCMNLGVVALDRQSLTEAVQNFDTALDIFARHLGNRHPASIRCKSHLATIHMLRQDPQAAEERLREIVEDLVATAPANSASLVDHRYRLSIALARQGKYEEAGPLLKTVTQQQRQMFGEADARTMKSLQAYAMLLERIHQHDAAEAVRQQIQRVARLSDNNDFQPLY